MSLKQTDEITGDIQKKFFSEFSSLIEGSEGIANYVSTKVDEWNAKSRQYLAQNFPYADNEALLEQWKEVVGSKEETPDTFENATNQYLMLCKDAKRPINKTFWHELLYKHRQVSEEPPRDLAIDAQLLLNEWQKEIDEVRTAWELHHLKVLRKQLIDQLEDFLRLLQELHNQLGLLGLESGLFLDLSKGSLTDQDIQQLKRWAKYLAEDSGVRSLCDLLGKMRQIELSEKIERIQMTHTLATPKPDINSREEIIGIRLGKEIEYALPSELALLSDPETSLLFDLKYFESRLMCFEMQGNRSELEHHEYEEDVQTQEKAKQGPMILCVDTSGSMSGMPEVIAKAVVLYMASKAQKDKRPCYLINFSTGIHILDVGESLGMTSLIQFLQMSFHGGTDASPALRHALGMMQKDAYQKADLLMISDFIMGNLPTDLLKQIEIQRENGNQFYSLVVGSWFMSNRLRTFFDQEWVFDPATSHIQEVVHFQQNIYR